MEMVNAVLSVRRRETARPRIGPAPLLDGIRRGDWARRPALAKRLGVLLAARGEVAYCVSTPDEARRAGNLLTPAVRRSKDKPLWTEAAEAAT